ncbi:MAG: hypothetical protein J1F33_02345 [Clostridiales bacterium]|nr:hypothetical protein [Clostridiales bacterium]
MNEVGSSEVLPLTKKQKYACYIVTGAFLLAAGLILVLSGVGVISASVGDVAAPTVLYALGVSILISAVITKNSISLWIAGVMLTCASASLIEVVTSATYGNLYPMYIAAPGVGCAFSLWLAEDKPFVIKPMIFFGGLAAVFSLNSSGACGWGITGGVLAAYIGLVIIAIAINAYLGRNKNNA